MGESCSTAAQRHASNVSPVVSDQPLPASPQAQTAPLARDNKSRLLYHAYQGGIREVVSCLEEGFPINQPLTAQGWSLLHLAAQSGDVAMLDMLINTGAKVDIVDKEYMWTPLMVAAMNGQEEAVSLLAEKGASLTAKDKDGDTAKTLAEKYSQRRVAKILGELARRRSVLR